MAKETDAFRRSDELEALQAFYGDDIQAVDEESSSHTTSASTANSISSNSNGPWRIKVGPKVVLELILPANYPSQAAPSPRIHAPPWVLNESVAADLIQELVDLWTEDTEVAIVWAEHCRAELGLDQQQEEGNDDNDHHHTLEEKDEDPVNESPITTQTKTTKEGVMTFHPHTSKFGQPLRHFDAGVILNESNRRVIHRGSPYHPPKSGPSEILIAHVASVQRMDHVHWVLAELLFQDRKVAKAAHNMIAYRFWDSDRECLVSDNDDDGEKGSGSKLAALLEMADARNAMVVVSRWFGGVLLGPSRFKYIACTARDALDEAGFLPAKK
jgi:hypothetical protein